MQLRFECSPKRGMPPVSLIGVKHNRRNLPRIAYRIGFGEQTFVSFAPLRVNESRPWLEANVVEKEVDADNVMTFSFELVEVCTDVILLSQF